VEEQYEWNFTLAETHWQKALDLDPRHSRARAQRALWGCFRGAVPVTEALSETRRAMHDDPLNSWVVAMHSYVLGVGGWHEESLAEAERALGLDADSFFSQWNVVRAHAWCGDLGRAIDRAPAVLAESGRHQWVLGLLAWVYGRSGDPVKARAVHDELEGRSRHEFVSPFWLATAASAAGLPDEVLRRVKQAVAERDPLILWSRVNPIWKEVRELPGLEEFLRPVWK
jgi:tetratricopeptide (TPR) repeat protein